MSIKWMPKRPTLVMLGVILILWAISVLSPDSWQDRYVRPLHEFILLLATVVLAWATSVLAEHTKMINEREKELRRFQDLQRCVSLAQVIIMPSKDKVKELSHGNPTSDVVRPFNELLTLSKCFHDSDTRRDLEVVTSELTNALLSQQGRKKATTKDPLLDRLTKLRSRLVQEIVEWQRDLGNYSRG